MAFFDADQLALLSGSTVYVDMLAELRFKSETLRVWNGKTDLVAGGHTWKPLKGVASIEGLAVSGMGQSEAINMTVSGIPDSAADILSLALEETPDANQQLAIIYLQFFGPDWQNIGTPYGIFWGFMQPPKVSRSEMGLTEGSVQTVSIVAENAFFNRSRAPNGRYTDRDQQARSPGDKFFQFVAGLVNKTVVWPDFVFLFAAGAAALAALVGAGGLGQGIV